MQTTYKKSWLSLFLLSIIMLVLAACGNKAEEGTETEGAEGNNDSKAEETYTIEHAMGTTEITGTPKKVVILTNEGTEALLSLGVKPVGAVQSWLGEPWYEHIASDMKDVEVVGTESEINIEAIAALKPDLIIGNKMRQEKSYEQLKAIAPTVFSETLRGDWQENFKLYAKALNLEEDGQKVIDDFEARITEFKETAGDKLNQEVSVVRFMAGLTRVYYTDTFSGVIFDKLGLKHSSSVQELFADNKDDLFVREVGKEVIPKMDADILFYFTYAPPGDTEATKTEEEWTNDPLWKNLEVVKAGKAYKVDDAIWNTAGGVLAANKLLDDLEEIIMK
ncbi:ABC transporter substrate-binding protein [Metabacillus sediminilitoris]|uniref:Iron-siderophore ABC transporter substrate-binding protein n=1 Tax=Metabacillus sediminilitoris TaxID=2567941 RepID=A0A4S4C5K2_9BACI|nr:iron-siderophore ABC transporter substrate-binding protein [Metabacillus sediminilitoris]QGQ47914.1 ABC transporter substrate-binding protein [Metabacillus sediminilitoris]THF80972.1 iron-siderophore ABC transporter substrate-binding protein [Metabacillus sediminilitoris]